MSQNQESSAQNTPNETCSICGEKLVKNAEVMGIHYSFRVMCKCKLKQIEEEKLNQERIEKMQRVEKLKKFSLLGERYKNTTFESSQTGYNSSFDKAFKRCRTYCEIHEITIKNGYGIYLFGDKGTGKTHITACMANNLMSKCVPVLFTNLFEISKAVKSTFSRETCQTEQALIYKFSNIDVLFFDDLGTEIFTKNSNDTWLQGLLFDLINKRYNCKKATIFSSNYSLNDLINKRGIAEKTVDRISEMTAGAVMKIEGTSLRNIQNQEKIF